MAMPDDFPFENAPDIQRVMQWALDDIFNNKQPLPELWDRIPKGPAMEAFQELRDALPNGGVGVQKVFKSITSADAFKWLKLLRSEPIPPRPGTEGENEGTKEEELPRGIHIGKSGKPVFTRMLESDVDELPDIAFRIQCVLPESGVTLVYGPSGTGKTFFGYHIAQCLAHNMHWFGRRITGCKVLYVYAEGRLGLKLRQKAWYLHHEKTSSGNLTFIPMPIQILSQQEILIDTIKEMIATGEKPDVIIIDTFSNCTSGIDQNLQKEVEPVLHVCHDIRDTYNLQIMLVHHTNKEDGFNGSQAFKNHVDTMIKLSADKTDTSLLTVECEKQRDGAERFDPFNLSLLEIPLGTHPITNDAISSAVLVATVGGPLSKGNLTQIVMLEILSAHGELNMTKWMELCKEQEVNRREFDKEYDSLVNKGKIIVTKGSKNANICKAAPEKQ
jgi:KaiC/GvpD/RAD55 family RecA-like ATPase